MKMWRVCWNPVVLTAVLSWTACSGIGSTGTEDATGPEDIPLGADTGPVAVGQCELERSWWTGRVEYEQVGGSPGLSVSPTGTLLVRSGGGPDTFYRMEDGARLGADGVWWPEPPDSDWHWRVRVEHGDGDGSIEAFPAAGGTSLLTVNALAGSTPQFEWLRQLRGFLSSGSERMVQVACWSGPGLGFDALRIAAWDLPEGTMTGTVDIELACGNPWPQPAPAVLGPQGRFILLTSPGDTRLVHVDLDTSEVRFRDVLDGRTPVEPINHKRSFSDYLILGLAVRPDGGEVAVSDRSGRVTRWTLPELEPVASPYESVVVGINQHTYQPSVESPVAWSMDGKWLAHLGPDGEAVLRSAVSGTIQKVLERPDAGDLSDLGPDTFNPATAFLFLSDGSGILVAHEAGISAWRCQGIQGPMASGDIVVELDGPTVITAGQEAEWTATAQTSGQPVVFRLLIDGDESPPQANLSGQFMKYFYKPGTVTLRTRVDDGSKTSTSDPLTVLVEPPPP